MKAHVGQYRIEAPLGRGGMGVVYRGVHEHLGRQVAVKALAPELTQQPEFKDRFFAEAKTQARLQHPNIVGVYDLLEDGGEFFIVMEFVAGEPLDDRLRASQGSGLDLEPAMEIFSQVLSALDYAHSEGVIHRDIKPSNVLVTEGGRIKLTDFGIALLIGDKRLTASQSSIGTPTYMSPEQIARPRSVDHRSDIYSAAVVFFEMLAGRPPFDDDTDYGIKKLHVETAPPDLSELRPSLPPALVQAVAKALAKDPDERHASAGLFLKDLQAAVPQFTAASHTTAAPASALRSTTIEPASKRKSVASNAPPARLAVPTPSGALGKPRWLLAGGAVLVLLVGILLSFVFLRSGGKAEGPVADTSAAAASAPAPNPVPKAAMDVSPLGLPQQVPLSTTSPMAQPTEGERMGLANRPAPSPEPRMTEVPALQPRPLARARENPPEPKVLPPAEVVTPTPVSPEPTPAETVVATPAAPAPAREGVGFIQMKDRLTALTKNIWNSGKQAKKAQETERGDSLLLERLDEFVEAAEDTREALNDATQSGLKAGAKGMFKKVLGRDETSEAAVMNLKIKIEGLSRQSTEIDQMSDLMGPGATSYWQEIQRYLKELKEISGGL